MSRTPIYRPIRFVRDEQELEQALEHLKQTRCPHSGHTGTLNRHDRLEGNDPEAADKQIERGRRAFCSNRGRRGGCGRTLAIVLAWVLPRHSVSAAMLGRLIEGLAEGSSVRTAWAGRSSPFSEQSGYQLRGKLSRRLDRLRAALLARCPPPPSTHSDPLRQSAEHLRRAFPSASCPPAAFQYALQTPILG